MPKTPVISREDIEKYVCAMPYSEFIKLATRYAETAGVSIDSDMGDFAVINLQKRLEKLDINSSCPYCDSDYTVKSGLRNNIQVYQCKCCHKKFTRFTGTILEKSRWQWELWVKVLEMTLNNCSLADMLNVLEKDYCCPGIDIKTIWRWRMKLYHAMAMMPQETLSGVIQVDETFIRESQKGSKHLISFLKKEERKPRYGRHPSNLGVMGPEFSNVVTAIDNRGYCVCKVACMGKLQLEIFYDLFDKHFNSPAYICSDNYSVYDEYCRLQHIPHYIKPSSYLTTLEENGIGPNDSEITDSAEREKILHKLFNDDLIDMIIIDGDRDTMTYNMFKKAKDKYKLSLGRVNELHSEIKKFLYAEKTNVSTKHLPDYIGAFSYIHNWRIRNGHYPTSHKDAEDIFVELIYNRTNLTVTELENRDFDLPKPSGQYVAKLAEETEKARKAMKSRYFKFNPEDGVTTFQTRKYLYSLPRKKLEKVAREYNIKGRTTMLTYILISELLKQSDIREKIYLLIMNDRNSLIDEEDALAIRNEIYRI